MKLERIQLMNKGYTNIDNTNIDNTNISKIELILDNVKYTISEHRGELEIHKYSSYDNTLHITPCCANVITVT